jgi:hypothetical protein
VGVVWNAYRKCRLLLLNFISTYTERLGDDDELARLSQSYSQRNLTKEARELSETIAASIPFHLYQNPTALDSHLTLKQEKLLPNSAYGGLLLMHILYVVSRLPIVPEPSRKTFNGALSWMGEVMGIGQAGLLANVSPLPRSSFFPHAETEPSVGYHFGKSSSILLLINTIVSLRSLYLVILSRMAIFLHG